MLTHQFKLSLACYRQRPVAILAENSSFHDGVLTWKTKLEGHNSLASPRQVSLHRVWLMGYLTLLANGFWRAVRYTQVNIRFRLDTPYDT